MPRVAQVPVIFMTGLTETEHVVQALESGGVDYLTKPINVDELRARIRVHLANARSAQSARVALDAAGRHLLAVRGNGRIHWSTPQATRLVNAAAGGDRVLRRRAARAALDGRRLDDAAGKTGGRASRSIRTASSLQTQCALGAIGGDEHPLPR